MRTASADFLASAFPAAFYLIVVTTTDGAPEPLPMLPQPITHSLFRAVLALGYYSSIFLTAEEAALAVAQEAELQRTRLTGLKRKLEEEPEEEDEEEDLEPHEWLQCDACNKWRIVPRPYAEGASEQWYCEML